MTVGRIPVIEGGIQPTIFDAKADLLTATANDTPARLAVGSDYGFLQADSAQSTGLVWNNAAWTSYTPTVGSQSGTITTATANGYYTRIGKTCVVSISATVTNKGTGAGFLSVSLPFTAAGVVGYVGAGREVAATGASLTGYIAPSGTIMQILTTSITSPIENSYISRVTITYEVA